jgi:hypothetical protein
MDNSMTDQEKPLDTLEQLIASAIRKSLNSDKLAEVIQKAAAEAVSDSIKQVFSYNSEFRKSASAAIQAAMPIVREGDVAFFTHAVNELVKKRLASAAQKTAEENIGPVLDQLLPPSPVISLAEFKEAFVQKLRDQYASDHDCDSDDIDDDEFDYTWEVKQGSGDYWHLRISYESDEKSYSTKNLNLAFSPYNPSAELSGSVLYECYHCYWSDSDVQWSRMFAGPLYGFDCLLFRIATKIARVSR